MPSPVWHDMLVDLSADVSWRGVEEGVLTPASAAHIRLHGAALRRALQEASPSSEELLLIADSCEALLGFLQRSLTWMKISEIAAFRRIHEGITGIPVLVRGPEWGVVQDSEAHSY
jgi:hypothetical protein